MGPWEVLSPQMSQALSEVCQIFSGRLTTFRLQCEFGVEGVCQLSATVTKHPRRA